ncbi:MAG: phosphotransferase [Acidobacteria bacterium]|uniref:Phosphotransferase n=1 Tax=Candidatus Polarisedimenticola svalbardensis TaxID=2886004 RepID=A0A8J6Y637_9BACT|nr:phosphotransferase [Candidatus Polarisedimenticola svalbardensis]
MNIDINNKHIVRYIANHQTGQDVVPIAGDASGRRFFRVGPGTGSSLVIMDYGGPFEDPTDDMILTQIFQDAGLPVADIVHIGYEGGFLVLEDLGERTLEDRLAEAPGAAPELYHRAVELAIQLAGAGTAALARSPRALSPALDEERFRFEMEYFLEHYYCGFLGNRTDDTHFQPLKRYVLDLAIQAGAVTPAVLCHRDFHSRNLIVAEHGRLSMVDIQDGRRGPLGYDLASLLWDAYVDIDHPTRQEMIRRFKEKTVAGDDFQDSLEVLAVQRMVKALGTFGYQISVMGRERYRSAIPRTIRNIRELAGNIAALDPVIDKSVP